jgi:hypothetical protein
MSSVSDGRESCSSAAGRRRRAACSWGCEIRVPDWRRWLSIAFFEAVYTTKPGSLGPRLSICRSMIETHGGRLWATANLPRGAIFEFIVSACADIRS